MPIPSSSVVGRWAGDHVALIGDYDETFAWSDLKHYTNISQQLVEEWNRIVGDKEFLLTCRQLHGRRLTSSARIPWSPHSEAA